MISFDGVEIEFSNMGLFSTSEPWIHPKRIIDSYEIIFCVDGSFHMVEENTYYHIEPQTAFFLLPNKLHSGFRKTSSPIKFYWLHFYCSNFEKLNLKKIYTSNYPTATISYLFKELISLQSQEESKVLLDVKLVELLIRLSAFERKVNNKIVTEIKEHIRINADKCITPSQIASKFGYTSGHLSRLFTKNLGISLRDYVIRVRIEYIKSLLLNSNYYIKEITELCHFENENNFVKFFKHHTGLTPTEYRNNNSGLHINAK